MCVQDGPARSVSLRRTWLPLIRYCVSWTLAVVAMLLAVTAFGADKACTSGSDCDGNGLDNFSDPCPALGGHLGASPAGTVEPQTEVLGFRDIACYAPFLPKTPGCI